MSNTPHSRLNNYTPQELEDEMERLNQNLERDRTAAESLIRWALQGGLDPHEICSDLGEEFERLLWQLAGEFGWKHVSEDELPF